MTTVVDYSPLVFLSRESLLTVGAPSPSAKRPPAVLSVTPAASSVPFG